MQRILRRFGRKGISFMENFGRSTLFLVNSLVGPRNKGLGIDLLIQQLYTVGVYSLAIILCSGFFVGMVLGLQGYTTLIKFGADQALGQLIALSLVRELGPVVSALLFAGRAGSALTAEIGLMKATEQLESLQLMAVDPLRRIIAPRFWAGVIAMPILALIFSAVGVVGGYLVAVEWLGVDSGAFWGNMQGAVSFVDDICNGIIKTAVFGFLVTWIAVFQGYDCIPTSEGIALATTRTVVYSSLVILGADFVLTAVMFGGLA